LLIESSALQETYSDNQIVFKSKVSTQFNNANGIQTADIDMFDAKDISVLCSPVRREYHNSKAFYSDITKNGKVAVHKLFKLLKKNRRRGIAKRIHAKEVAMYRDNKFDEIQLEAAWDGVVVWHKLFFTYMSVEEEKKLKKSLALYLMKVKKLAAKEIEIEIIKSFAAIKSSLLKGTGSQPSFTEWYEYNMDMPHLIKMYKRI
jgi:hypothetical protein